MTITPSTLLSLPLVTTGTETGTWGDIVNYGLTDYLDIAIAGTLTLTGDGAVTLANTQGTSSATNISGTTAQYAVLKIVGPLTATKVITAPSLSKTYIVNNTDSTYGVTVKASGQTGVTIAAGQRALVVYNGTDYVQVGASAGGSNTQVQYNNNGALAGSANLTFDGTTLTAANFADSSLTSGRVVTAGASGNLGDSANLTFNGTTLTANTLGLTNALTVANGGTGLTTTTAYSVVFSGTTATGNFQASAGPGTAGYILTSNGAGALPTFQAPAASGISQAKVTGINFIFSI